VVSVTAYVALVAVSTAVSVAVAGWLWDEELKLEGRLFVGIVAVYALAGLFVVAELLAPSDSLMRTSFRFQAAITSFLPLLWFLLILEHGGYLQRIPRPVVPCRLENRLQGVGGAGGIGGGFVIGRHLGSLPGGYRHGPYSPFRPNSGIDNFSGTVFRTSSSARSVDGPGLASTSSLPPGDVPRRARTEPPRGERLLPLPLGTRTRLCPG
jgi:hypothetical protein